MPFVYDLRYGLRSLIRTPGFTIAAVTVLALGIGVNAAVFSLVNAAYLRPLPVAAPSELVRVYSNRFSNTGYRTYVELRDRNSTLSGLAAFQMLSFAVRIDSEPEHAFGEIASGEYFPVLGVTAAGGRLFGPADDRPDAAPVMVISHAYWTRRFGSAADAVGRTIAVNGQPFTIVGITPERFTGVLAPLAADFWMPLSADARLRPNADGSSALESTSFHLVGRLKPGVDRQQAQAELDAIGRQLRAAAGEPAPRERAVTVYGSTILHPEASGPVTAFTAVLLAIVSLVLMIVCVNVANLVLARAAGRDVELAVRQSLGAGRARLVRQLLTENLILSLVGAGAGLGIAIWATRLLMAIRIPAPVPLFLDLPVDWRVLLFTTAVAMAATLAFGLAPALTVSRIDLVRSLKGFGGSTPYHSRLRSMFLVAQVSMSVVLLVVAGLFIRSFHYAQSISTGFDVAGVLTASIDLEARGYGQARGLEFLRALDDRLNAAPGVIAANAVDIVPVTLSNTTASMLRDGDAVPAPGQPPVTPMIYTNAVGPGHFRTLAIPILAGRDFTHLDTAQSNRVAIVNETFARRFWPSGIALGQRLHPLDGGSGDRPIEIIGVVRDSKYVTIGEAPRPFLYRPLSQAYTPHITLLVRTATDTATALSIVKREVRALDPALPVFNAATLTDATSVSLLPARLGGQVLTALGILALVLAALGIYGVLSFLVRSRTREIGVRIAIGAAPRAVVALVVRQAIIWTITGASIGLVLALLLTRFLTSFLYGISPTDASTLGAVIFSLVAVAAIAALVPAVRASRVDPLIALRTM